MLKKSLSLAIPTIQLPKRFEGTIVERWANYWKGLFRDYKDVGIDSYKTIISNPKKSVFYTGLAGFTVSCYKQTPNHNDLKDQLLQLENLIGLVPESSQNQQAIAHTRYLNQLINSNKIRITSLGVFSIMWVADYSSDQATYDATCNYLQPEWTTFGNRIIDVGFWNIWWNLQKSTKDYDVNF